MKYKKVKITESANTFGCSWIDEDNKMHYGFYDMPVNSKTRTFVDCLGGYAAHYILDNTNSAQIVDKFASPYGGEKVTVEVSIPTLEILADVYWERAERQDAVIEEQSKTCHYCGLDAVNTGFFGESVCSECGGK